MLQLRDLTPRDEPLLRKWLNRPHIRRWFGDPEGWLIGMFDGEDHHAPCLIERDGKPLAFLYLYEAFEGDDEYWRSSPPIIREGDYAVDFCLGSPLHRRSGFGKEAGALILEKIKTLPDAKRVIADPSPWNHASQRLLRRLGFKRIGRRCLQGDWAIIMALDL